MLDSIYLPKLNNLSPTMESTLLKIMEEAGELSRAVLKFLPYEQMTQKEIAESPVAAQFLSEVAGELLDVAQTCVTMIFVMEDRPEFSGTEPEQLIELHLKKLEIKGYHFDHERSYRITNAGNFKYMALPRLQLEQVTLLTTVCKIQEELGELTQYLGKHSGASGERCALPDQEIASGCAQEMLDIAQCCFTMMYILAERYGVNIHKLIDQHVGKLKRKGYCA
ncbi:MAG: nucleotide pyrophosphohydrolase [Pelosinus sp.]|nr:nucleotide pyrophosphohydrolase [Pelosinus sp.]